LSIGSIPEDLKFGRQAIRKSPLCGAVRCLKNDFLEYASRILLYKISESTESNAVWARDRPYWSMALVKASSPNSVVR